MRHLAFSAVAVLALVTACTDRPKQSPTEPSEASAAVVVAPTRDGEVSSLCAAYQARLGEARQALNASRKDPSLQESVATYEAVIADACP